MKQKAVEFLEEQIKKFHNWRFINFFYWTNIFTKRKMVE